MTSASRALLGGSLIAAMALAAAEVGAQPAAVSAGVPIPPPARVDLDPSATAARVDETVPSAFRVLQPRLLTPAFLDGAPSCLHSLAPVAARATGRPRDDFEALAARIQRSRPPDIHPLRESIRETMEFVGQPLVTACLRIETARMLLRVGFAPEAIAELRRAERAREPAEWLPSMRDTARYYRAEARIRMGETSELPAAFESLLGSPYRAVAAAARLRIADLALRPELSHLTPEAAAERWKDLRLLLEQGRLQGLDAHSWAPVASELALAAGHLAEAHRWLAIAEGQPEARDAAAIAKADVLILLGQRDEARTTLRRVLVTARERAARELAAVRLARHSLVTGGSAERIELLEKAAFSRHPAVTRLARERLARERLAVGKVDAALAQLRELAHDRLDEFVAPLYPHTLDRALEAAIDSAECPLVLGRLSSMWELFLRASSREDVFLRVGDCHLELGMAREALAVFRGLVRRFGADAVPNVDWRVAHASLEAGELSSARAALRARQASQRGLGSGPPQSEEAARWQELAARMAHLEGRDADALKLWLALAHSPRTPPDLRGDVEFQLLRAWRAGDERFARAIEASLREPAWGAPGLRAALRVELGDLQWNGARLDDARVAYQRALEDIDSANARGRAAYRSALTVRSNDGVRAALRPGAETPWESSWNQLALLELRMMNLREAVGRETRVDPARVSEESLP